MKSTCFSSSTRTKTLVGILLLLLLVWAAFHRQINRSLAERLFLAAKRPTEEAFNQVAAEASDPVAFLNRCWKTGKVTHRQLVAAFLKDHTGPGVPWLARAEPLLVAGAVDADASVRELALAALEEQHSPRLFECARVQLGDLDPMLRLLGLDYLRKAPAREGVPLAIKLLDDPDPRVVATAEVALTRWSGEDYGVRTHLAIPSQPGTRGQLEPEKAEAIRRGVERREQWWQIHAKEYPADSLATSVPIAQVESRLPAPDFALNDLQGNRVDFASFRGKVVLLNFWATWCTACLAEIPELIALQNKAGSQVAIIGVALDGVPDEHGHDHEAGAEEGHDPHEQSENSLGAIRAKVERAVRARGINYTVLLDPTSLAGGQYNGGELPTTVIFDAQGRVRRRFIGERSLPVFEAMVAEAARAPTKSTPQENPGR